MARHRTDILVVDDDIVIRTLLTEILTNKAGRHVTAVASGAEALAFLDIVRPDLIVLDVMMPDIDGVTLFRLIRERVALAAVPVLFVSALSRAHGNTLEGTFQWLDKPFTYDELDEMVADLLGEGVYAITPARPDKQRPGVL